MKPISAPNALIDAQELAHQLGIPLNAVYRLSASGKLPRYKLGHRTVRFRLSEVLAVLRQEPEPAPAVPEAEIDDIDAVLATIELGDLL